MEHVWSLVLCKSILLEIATPNTLWDAVGNGVLWVLHWLVHNLKRLAVLGYRDLPIWCPIPNVDCYAVILNLRKVSTLWVISKQYAHLAIGLVVVAYAVEVESTELFLSTTIGRGVVPLDILAIYWEDLKACRSAIWSKVWASMCCCKPPCTAYSTDIVVNNVCNLRIICSLFAVGCVELV